MRTRLGGEAAEASAARARPAIIAMLTRIHRGNAIWRCIIPISTIAATGLKASRPLAERIHIRRRSISQPPIELRLVLELLPASPRHHEEIARDFRHPRHIAPQLFPL